MVELGSDASAACGGLSELSAWQRSARDDGGNAEDIRRAPQQEDLLDLGAVTSVKVFRFPLISYGQFCKTNNGRRTSPAVHMRMWWNW